MNEVINTLKELLQSSFDDTIMSSSTGYEIGDEVYEYEFPICLGSIPSFVNKLKLSSIYGLIPRGNFKRFSVYDYALHRHNIYQNFIYHDPRSLDKCMQESYINEYRKFIEESKYKGIKPRDRQISISRIQCSESHGNNIKYDSRRIFDDMGK